VEISEQAARRAGRAGLSGEAGSDAEAGHAFRIL